MLPTLIYATLSFWLLTLMQAAVIPFWLGDFVFLAIFVWSLYVAKYRQGMGFPIWGYWIPLVFGLGMASFLFFSLWALLPYIIGASMLTYLLTSRSKWIFRWKEGFGSILVIFLAYAIIIILIRREVMQYIVTIDFLIRFLITFVLGLIVWGYMVRNAKRGKIR
ncbi:MAG: hypothetical protein V1690_00185 [Candidatus Moraniibacteriota bacterium]